MATLKFKNPPVQPSIELGEVRLDLPPSKSLLIRQIFLETALWIRSVGPLESEPKDRTDLAEDIRSALALTTAIRRHMLAAKHPSLYRVEQPNLVEQPNPASPASQRTSAPWSGCST